MPATLMSIQQFTDKTAPFVLLSLIVLSAYTSQAEGQSSAAEMARKLQDPLANISAIMTDNDILHQCSPISSIQELTEPSKHTSGRPEAFL